MELYQITGTFKASTDFTVIANDIEDATAELCTTIGPVVEQVQKNYTDGEENDTLKLVQRVIASRALCYFAKNTGLSHDSTGRKLKVDENEKIPFEWMIDRDDRELKERYYRALDRLYLHLEKEDSEEWKKCSISKQRAELFVKDFNVFESVYPLNGSRYTFYKLIPLMLEAQKRLAIILKSNDSLPDNPGTSKYIILKALVIALERWNLNIFPLEISRGFSPSYQGNKETQPATLAEIDRTKAALSSQAEEALKALLIEINKDNPTTGASLLPKNDRTNKFFTT